MVVTARDALLPRVPRRATGSMPMRVRSSPSRGVFAAPRTSIFDRGPCRRNAKPVCSGLEGRDIGCQAGRGEGRGCLGSAAASHQIALSQISSMRHCAWACGRLCYALLPIHGASLSAWYCVSCRQVFDPRLATDSAPATPSWQPHKFLEFCCLGMPRLQFSHSFLSWPTMRVAWARPFHRPSSLSGVSPSTKYFVL